MKPKSLNLVAYLGSATLIATSLAQASTLYWDGNDTNANANGGAGTWNNLSTANWDTTVINGVNSQWDNTLFDTAVFGAASGAVTLGSNISVGGMRFNTTGYSINTGANTLTFGAANNTIAASGAGSPGNVAATITGAVGGSGNVILTALNGPSANTVTFNGTSAGGWTGTTTINPGMTMNVAGNNQALLNTSAIILNGGNIQLTNTATGSENTINRISDTAAIASYGSTSITIANTATSGRVYSETIGAITHYNGQLGIGFNTIQNGGGTPVNTQTLNVNGLTNSGSTSTIAINSSGSAGVINGNSNIRVSGVSETAAGEIVGPWMTAGGVNNQSDWAVYTADIVGGYRRIGSKGGTAVAETSWTSSSATGNYNASATAPTASPVNTKLTADRFVNTLRVTFGELTSNAGANWSIDGTLGVEKVNFATHNLSNGDVVHFRSAPTGLQDNRPYYVINAIASTSFQLSLTPGGPAMDLTSATSGFMATGINLNGNTLGLNGYINSGTGSAAIGGGSASTLTLATGTTGNLYLHGPANMWIDPSIKNNGAGVLTLVKSGTTTLTLSGDNTYTGGTVINAGTVNFATTGSWVSGQNITFGGAGSIAASVGALTGGTMKSEQGAFATMSGSSGFNFASTTGEGTILYNGSSTLNLGNASGFTGDLISSINGSNNSSRNIQFSSIADTVGSTIGFGGGEGDSNQRAVVTLGGNAGAVTLDNRQVGFLTRFTGSNSVRRGILQNNNATSSNAFVINSDLFNNSDRSVEFILEGSNTGNNAFNGDIGNSSFNGSALGVYKAGTGKWILGGTNTFTGTVIVNNGILSVASINNSDTAGTLGMNNTIQLGGQDPPASGTAYLTGSNSGTLEYTGTGQTSTRSFRIGDNVTAGNTGGGGISNNGASGALVFTNASFNTAVGTATGDRTLTLGGTNTGANEIQGAIVDNSATGNIFLAKTDAGRWILSGSNTYTGTTTINAGVLQGADGTGLATASILQLRGGVFQSSGTFTRNVGTAAGNVNWGTGSGGFAAIGGALNLQLNGGTGSLTWNGSSMVSSGQALIFGSTSADSLVDFQNGLNLGSSSSGQRTISVTDNTSSSTDRARISGAITNTAAGWGIIKEGNGILELTNTNTYTGATSVNGGALLINGSNTSTSLTSLFTVNTAATLGGTGSIGGAVTVKNGGTLAPGASIESLASGALTMESGSTFAYEVLDNSATGADLLGVNGGLSLTGVNLNFDLATAAALAGSGWTVGDKLTLISYGASAITSGFTGYADDTNYNFGSNVWTFNYNDTMAGNNFASDLTGSNRITMTAFTVIPEPSSAALLGALGMLALLRRRR